MKQTTILCDIEEEIFGANRTLLNEAGSPAWFRLIP